MEDSPAHGQKRSPLGNVANALIALRHATRMAGHSPLQRKLIYHGRRPCITRAPEVPFPWADEHDILTAAWMQHQGIAANKEIAGQAAQAVSREHPFHPIRDYLDSLTWDGISRIDDWVTLYLGAEPSDYVRAVGSRFLIGGVARIYRPACKNDTCPIFEGPQGLLKSTALRTLAGDEFFTDDIADLGSKDSVMQTRGVWLIELAELDSMSRSDVSRVKAFMSRQVDRIRLPYGRRVIEAPRECIFAGTTNRSDYLKDESGARRFWPIRCGVIRIDDLRRDRDQLWAEAKARFEAGCKWWLDSKVLVLAAAEEQQARYEGDAWDGLIETWIHGRESVTVSDVLELCLEKKKTHGPRLIRTALRAFSGRPTGNGLGLGTAKNWSGGIGNRQAEAADNGLVSRSGCLFPLQSIDWEQNIPHVFNHRS